MDHLHSHFVRAERADAVRKWAALEAKSETMAEDLCRQQAERTMPPPKKQPRVVLFAELLFATFDAWLHFRSR